MAHMIPPNPPTSGPGAAAEKLLYDALARLDDEWFVYHRLAYVRDGVGEGEADFLVLHRNQGLLVIECKGAGVRRTGDGVWVREGDDDRTEQLKESPMVQAERHVRQLVGELDQRLQALPQTLGQTDGFPFVFGHAVAFPRETLAAGPLPLDMPRALVFDATALGQLAARIPEALAFWARTAGRRVLALPPPQFMAFRRKCLHPTLHICRSLGADMAAEDQMLVRLSAEQIRVAELWQTLQRFRVQGGAGTGKTLLAIETAKRMAEQGARVLFVCFNIYLAREAATRFAQEPPVFGSVTALHFHALCQQAAGLLGRSFKAPEDPLAAAQFWTETAPNHLLDALTEGVQPHFDAIVVDEGQDFEAAWWYVLEQCQPHPGKGRLAVFFDPGQDIFDRAVPVPDLPTLVLSYNYRNTKSIADCLRLLVETAAQSLPESPDGEPPQLHDQSSAAEIRKTVARIIERAVAAGQVRPEQITLLTPRSRKNSSLAGQVELAGLRLADDPGSRSGALLHTTIGKFKGLESDFVILLDIDPEDERCSRKARYVAASRARMRLHVCSKGSWLRGA